MSAATVRILAGLLLTGFNWAAFAEQGPRERECMAGEQRIEGECQPFSRGAKNKGSGSR
jgi:hypothetical protein